MKCSEVVYRPTRFGRRFGAAIFWYNILREYFSLHKNAQLLKMQFPLHSLGKLERNKNKPFNFIESHWNAIYADIRTYSSYHDRIVVSKGVRGRVNKFRTNSFSWPPAYEFPVGALLIHQERLFYPHPHPLPTSSRSPKYFLSFRHEEVQLRSGIFLQITLLTTKYRISTASLCC